MGTQIYFKLVFFWKSLLKTCLSNLVVFVWLEVPVLLDEVKVVGIVKCISLFFKQSFRMCAWGILFWIDELAIVIRRCKTIDYNKNLLSFFTVFGPTNLYTVKMYKLISSSMLHRVYIFFKFTKPFQLSKIFLRTSFFYDIHCNF